MEFSIDEIRQKAISAMETCMAYCTKNDVNNAYRSRGEASVWENMLLELGVDLETEDEHYGKMLEMWVEYKLADRS